MSSLSTVTGFHQAMRDPIRRSVVNAVEWQLGRIIRQEERRRVALDADTLVALLEKVLLWSAPLDSERLATFVGALLDLMVEEGPGTDFRQQHRCLDVTDAAIARLAKQGGPTAHLRLAQAKYLAIFDNNGAARLEAIQAAVRESRTDAERLPALLTLAKSHIDSSKYRQARQILPQCDELAHATPSLYIFLPDVMTAWGMSYFYGSRKRAEPFFREALLLGADMPSTPVVTEALTAARHYLGRIQAGHGNWQAALDLYVQARPNLNNTGKGEAFFHLRLADVLIEMGAYQETSYHLHKSSELFRAIQEASTGEIQLNLALARLHVRQRDRRAAAAILKTTLADARNQRYPRGELRCAAELVKILLIERRFAASLPLLARMLAVFVIKERWGGVWSALTEIRTAVGLSRRRSRRATPAQDTLPPCPCGADHDQPDSA